MAEQYCSYGVLKYGGNSGEWANIFDSDSIDFLVVKEGAKAPILFAVVEDRGTVWGVTFSDESMGQIFFDVLFLELLFHSRELIWGTRYRCGGIWYKFDL